MFSRIYLINLLLLLKALINLLLNALNFLQLLQAMRHQLELGFPL